jgi:hypothetical protein
MARGGWPRDRRAAMSLADLDDEVRAFIAKS